MRIKRLRAVYAALGLGVICATFSVLPWILVLEENFGLAWLFVLRGSIAAPRAVAVAGISGESAEALGQRTLLDEDVRAPHARLVARLSEAGAAVIVMDVGFQAEGDPEQDAELADAIAAAGNVLLLARVTYGEEEIPAPNGSGAIAVRRDLRHELVAVIERSALATAPFTLPRVPVRVSQFWVFDGAGSDNAQLPLTALQAYLLPRYDAFLGLLERQRPGVAATLPQMDEAHADLRAAIRAIRRAFLADPELRDDLRAALDETRPSAEADELAALIDAYGGRGSRYLNYYGASGTIETIPYHEILETPAASLASAVAGRAVFVGFSERRPPDQEDEFISVYSERSGISLSGVEIGATAFANLLDRKSIEPLSIPVQWFWVLVWGVLLTLALALVRLRVAFPVGIGAGLAYLAAAVYAFDSAQSWWPVVVPLCVQLPLVLVTLAGFRYRDINAQRDLVQAALGRYLPPPVVSRLAAESFDSGAERELVHGTCLITDIEQYTGVAEAMAPDGLVELMRGYFAMLSARVEENGGYVADVSGDSMVAIWAGAVPDARLRRRACEAALAMQAQVERFNRDGETPQLPTGMGLDSGEVVLGNIGAEARYRFRAVGDIVNTASRIQGLNRRLGTRVLASNAAIAGVPGVATRRVGEFLLLGKRAPVVISELLDAAGSAAAYAGLREMFAAGLQLFEQRRFSEACRQFERILKRHPGDGPSLFYISQCEVFAARNLPEDWAGTIQIPVK